MPRRLCLRRCCLVVCTRRGFVSISTIYVSTPSWRYDSAYNVTLG